MGRRKLTNVLCAGLSGADTFTVLRTVSIRNLSLEELKSLKQYELIRFNESWLMKEGENFEIFGETTQYIKDLVTNKINYVNLSQTCYIVFSNNLGLIIY